VDTDFGLSASQVEKIWDFVGFLLYYLKFGILHLKIRSFLVEEVELLAGFAS